MKKLNKKGFTLVELLAVIVILALLMVVSLSVMGNVQNNAKKTALKTEAQKLLTSINNDLSSAKTLGTVDDSTVKGYVAKTDSDPAYVSETDGTYTIYVTLDTDNLINRVCITDKKNSMIVTTADSTGTPDSGTTYEWSTVPTLPESVKFGTLATCSYK